MNKLDLEQKVINAILLLGVLLSLIQFIYNRSLWLDEAMLAFNIIHKNSNELLKPLDYYQVAPILFLQLEKFFSILIDNSEYGLRLLLLLSFWCSLYFFYRIIRLLFTNPYTIIFGLSIFVFNHDLLYFSSEVKQYMCDVLVLTSIYYILLKPYKNVKNKYYLLGAIGSLNVFLSNVTPIILFSAGTFLLYELLINKKINFLFIGGVILLWTITFLLYYYFFIEGHPAKDMMLNYWTNNNAFMPHNITNSDFYKFLVEKTNMVFRSHLNLGKFGVFFIPVFLFGYIALFRRYKIDIILITLIPIVLHLLLSGFKLYPFDTRLILYICPLTIIIVSFGFDCLRGLTFNYFKIKRATLLAPLISLLFLIMFFRNPFPMENQELKKGINYISNHLKKGDKIYVSSIGIPAMKYYNDTKFINFSAPIIFGSNNYIDDLKSLKGRNWLLFVGNNTSNEVIIQKLNSLNYNKLQLFKSTGVGTLLYKFPE